MKKNKRYFTYIKILAFVFFISSMNIAYADVTPPKVKAPQITAEVIKNATTNLEDKTLQQLVASFVRLTTRYVLQLLLALTVMMFLWGLMKYMFKGQGSDTARAEGRKLMLWGIIGLFVVTTIWGLVAIFASFVGHGSVVIPQFTN